MQTNRVKTTLLQVQVVAGSIFLLFFLISLRKIGTFTLDETLFHFPNLVNFYENGLRATFNSKYSTANTPLPYIIVAAIAKITAPTLFVARVVTALVSFSTFLLAMRLLHASGASKAGFFVILFFPYFFLHSFTFYAVNYGLFFALLGLLLYHRTQQRFSPGSYLAVGVCFSLAALCQQFYLLFPAAVFLPMFCRAVRSSPGKRTEQRKHVFIAGVMMLIPLAAPLLLFREWGGLTHINFKEHTNVVFGPSNLVAVCFVTGFYCSPFVLQSVTIVSKRELFLAAVLAVVGVLFFRPEFSDRQGAGLFTGITLHMISIIGNIHHSIATLFMMVLTCFGLLVFTQVARSLRTSVEYVMATACSLLVVTYAINTQLGERHLLPFMTLLFLIILPRLKKTYTMLHAVFMACVGIGYFFYWTFIKFA